ncbi:MAG: DUF1836 domain-containing protein [Clostridia bacterium]|nr:DUF1836 domain-containing protein [Clostridia bacterium]
MSDKKTEQPVLETWCETATADEAIVWDRLPELKLYMDQVLTLLEKELAVASEDGDNPVTSSMINNYVKDGVLPRPEKKKYGREHLAYLYIICMLKSQLPLPQIARLLEMLSPEEPSALYDDFIRQKQAALADAVDRIREAGEDPQAKAELAMSLALEANAKHLAAGMLMRSLMPNKESEKEAAKIAKKEAKKAAKESEGKAE